MRGPSQAEPPGLPPGGPPRNRKSCPGMIDSSTSHLPSTNAECQPDGVQAPGAKMTQEMARLLFCGARCGTPEERAIARFLEGQPKGGLSRMARFPRQHWELMLRA